MEQQARLSPVDGASGQVAGGSQRRFSGLVAVPIVVAGAACLLPVAVTLFGVTRLAQGRWNGIGSDSAAAARAMWRATHAAVDALTSPAEPRT